MPLGSLGGRRGMGGKDDPCGSIRKAQWPAACESGEKIDPAHRVDKVDEVHEGHQVDPVHQVNEVEDLHQGHPVDPVHRISQVNPVSQNTENVATNKQIPPKRI